ncbi:MAG: ABC transporter ATP-binding protein [Actinomycetota bacterium]|nr:ABC transporter ATP-binding protein [Actinomycetota bacterium]
MPLLEINGLKKAFGGVKALDGVDFHINENEIVSVIGPNGAGKTSFFNVISGMFPLDEGEIVFDGDNLAHHQPNEITRRGIARTFQNVRLFPNLTVLENVMVGQHCRTSAGMFGTIFQTKHQRAEEEMISEKSKEILSFFGTRLAGYRHDQSADSLSYANRRRLEIARALGTEPRLLLLDEPTAGMNPKETIELTGLIGKMRDERGLTVIVISHEMKVVEDVSDRVVVLDHGVKIAEGHYDDVSTNPDVIEAYLGRPAEKHND